MDRQSFEYVIIGSGLAGLYTALEASKYGSVAIVTKSSVDISNSYWAQGGIAAAVGKDDSTELHIQDTLKAGRGLCSYNAVKILVEEGKERILELIQMGMPFDKIDNEIALALEGGHSRKRVLHAGQGSTGKELVKFIQSKIVNNKSIKVFENCVVYNLLRNDERCFGLNYYSFQTKKCGQINSKAVVVASGGGAGIYKRTTNPSTSLGEGIALAYCAGAEVENMEFLQFHPTSFYHESGETFLISEAIRGEGAYIVNGNGNRFLLNNGLTELSPRDVVSSAIYTELANSGKQNVYLDLTHLDSERIKTRFKTIYDEALRYELNITNELIPISPAAHYMCGGIKTDLWGQTNIKGLYAVGEAASTNVHGANRLASNSLLECLVFGKKAVEHMINQPFQNSEAEFEKKFMYVNENRKDFFWATKEKIASIMWNKVGIVRDYSSLISAENDLKNILDTIDEPECEYYTSRIYSIIDLSLLIIIAAIKRKESRGAHLRSDYPNEDDSLLLKFVQSKISGVTQEDINEA